MTLDEPSDAPTLSLVVPLYNEEGNVASTVTNLLAALDAGAIDFELLLIDNGSTDGTCAILEEFAARDQRLRVVHASENEGYGGGILRGLDACRGQYVGYAWGDEQVRSADVVRIFTHLRKDSADLAKACRVIRHDGPWRKIVTTIYHLCFPLFFPVRSQDINGCPKFFRREALARLELRSRDWFLDAEIMIKAERQGLRVIEVPVVFHQRRVGRSNVRLSTLLEFARNLVSYRIRGL